MVIEILVKEEDITFAKKQITDFEKTPKGNWRYSGVFAWRGVVCEMLTSNWLKNNFKVTIPAKGLDTSGIYDSYDLLINGKTIEIKSATCLGYKKIMPKKSTVDLHPNNICIGVKYNEQSTPNKIIIFGFLSNKEIQSFPIDQNKGAPYYDVPQSSFNPIEILNKELV